MRFRVACVVVAGLAACSHDFTLVNGDAGPHDAGADASVVDAPPSGPLALGPSGFTGEVMTTGQSFELFGGFTAGPYSTCPASGFCVQGGFHP